MRGPPNVSNRRPLILNTIHASPSMSSCVGATSIAVQASSGANTFNAHPGLSNVATPNDAVAPRKARSWRQAVSHSSALVFAIVVPPPRESTSANNVAEHANHVLEIARRPRLAHPCRRGPPRTTTTISSIDNVSSIRVLPVTIACETYQSINSSRVSFLPAGTAPSTRAARSNTSRARVLGPPNPWSSSSRRWMAVQSAPSEASSWTAGERRDHSSPDPATFSDQPGCPAFLYARPGRTETRRRAELNPSATRAQQSPPIWYLLRLRAQPRPRCVLGVGCRNVAT